MFLFRSLAFKIFGLFTLNILLLAGVSTQLPEEVFEKFHLDRPDPFQVESKEL